jgi:hypothetical protein
MQLTIAGGSAAESLVPEIEALGIKVNVLTPAKVAAACQLLLTKVKSLGVHHIGQPQLDDAALEAQKRDIGDGGWAFGRRKSSVDITPLYATLLPLWAVLDDDTPANIKVFGNNLDLCDQCEKNPHEDPDGEFDYLCTECRPERDED